MKQTKDSSTPDSIRTYALLASRVLIILVRYCQMKPHINEQNVNAYAQCLDAVALLQLRLHHRGECRTNVSTRPSYSRLVVSNVDLKLANWIDEIVMGFIGFTADWLVSPISMESRTDIFIAFKLFENLFHCSVSGRTSSNHLKSGKPSFHSSYLCWVRW